MGSLAICWKFDSVSFWCSIAWVTDQPIKAPLWSKSQSRSRHCITLQLNNLSWYPIVLYYTATRIDFHRIVSKVMKHWSARCMFQGVCGGFLQYIRFFTRIYLVSIAGFKLFRVLITSSGFLPRFVEGFPSIEEEKRRSNLSSAPSRGFTWKTEGSQKLPMLGGGARWSFQISYEVARLPLGAREGLEFKSFGKSLKESTSLHLWLKIKQTAKKRWKKQIGGLRRKQKIGVKKYWVQKCDWKGMPTILGVTFLGAGLKPWEKQGQKTREHFGMKIRCHIHRQFS